jgi:endonuclease-3
MSKIERICDLLDAAYGKQVMEPGRPPLDVLVLTILSQNTSSKNCHQAFASLRERFPTWEDVRIADVRNIADAIRPGGLAEVKAPRIKSILQQIYEAQGNFDLSWLETRDSKEIKDYLLSFYGVGPKTAACVLLFSLGRPVLPVDTHVLRVSKRLGLIDKKVSADEAHEILQKKVPEQRIYSLHLNMIHHGREICVAGIPKCSICLLKEDCDYFAESGPYR